MARLSLNSYYSDKCIKLTPSGLLYFYRLVLYQRSFFFVVDDTQHRDP